LASESGVVVSCEAVGFAAGLGFGWLKIIHPKKSMRIRIIPIVVWREEFIL
jgi:hypothetical protein